MPTVRVLDSNNNVVCRTDVQSHDDLAALEEEWSGCTLLFDEGALDRRPAAPSPEATMVSPSYQFGSAEDTARVVITQTLADFHAASRELLALSLDQTRHWLALGTRVVDEDVRRRDIMHKALKDLDIADRSISVLELQAKQAKWAPAPSPAPASAQEDGITSFLGAVSSVGKQLLDLDKKN